jgi:hypothetical protein
MRHSRAGVLRIFHFNAIAVVILAGVGASCVRTPPTTDWARDGGGDTIGPPASRLAPVQDANTTEASRIHAALGSAAFDSLIGSTKAEAGKLRIIAADSAEQQRFKGLNVVAGYPAQIHLVPLPAADMSRIIGVLGRDGAYDFNGRTRCKNESMLGIRFLGTQAVELAIGLPCRQAIWGVDGKRTGMGLSPQAASLISDAIARLLKN